MKLSKWFFVFLGLPIFLVAQEEESDLMEKTLYKHVAILADDAMMGRETGTEGEQLAADYISKQYKEAGLIGFEEDGGYLQKFEVLAGKNLGPNNSLSFNGKSAVAMQDYWPLEYSGNGSAKGKLLNVGYGMISPNPKLNDYLKLKKTAGAIFVMEVGVPKFDNPHAEEAKFADLRHKVALAVDRGAAGIIFINTNKVDTDPIPDFTRKLKTAPIPVVFSRNGEGLKTLNKKSAVLSVDLVEDRRIGKNVVGFDDNGASKTVVIGAHYDHLGMGHFGSRHTGEEKEIHNGADDNASGVAVMIELAKELQTPGHEAYNYLYIAFSGEEMGLLGSNYYVNNPLIDLASVAYMLNMDMIGRMKNRTLIVNGTGTSPEWGNLIVKAQPKNWALNITAMQSGTGPSDHTSFYLKGLPVLAFFSGTHKEYHTPEDDIELLNYKGMVQIMDFIHGIIDHSSDFAENFEFTKTKENKQSRKRRFNVTLGVMPNYAFEGEGMKIDGVTSGKPAESAGLQEDDIILNMGTVKVNDIYDYMDALEKYQKGDEIEVKVKRGEEIVTTKVAF